MRKNLPIAVLLMLLLAVQLLAAITLNSFTPAGDIETTSATVTLSIAPGAGSNRLALITMAVVDDGCGPDIGVGTSVVFNGTESATFIGGIYDTLLIQCIALEQWYIKMPSVTTADIVGTWSNTAVFIGISVAVLDGVEQTGTPHRTQTCTFDVDGSVQPDLAVEAVSGDLSIDGIVSWLDAITDPDAGQTERTDNASGGSFALNVSTEPAVDTSTEMGWTKDDVQYHAYCGVSIIPAAGGGGGGTVPIIIGTSRARLGTR